MKPEKDPTQELRSLYHAHLVSEKDWTGGDGKPVRPGKVAGKNTRRGMREAALWAEMTHQAWEELSLAWAETPNSLMVWSDLHLDHHNIIRYSKRPFFGTEAMNRHLLDEAIEHVNPYSWLLMLGDLAMWKDRDRIGEWLKLCPGRKAIIIGNHDVQGPARPRNMDQWRDIGFEAVADVAVLPAAHGHGEIWVTHYPLPLAPRHLKKGIVNLHGHTHASSLGGPHINACVEVNGYRPRPILEMLPLK